MDGEPLGVGHAHKKAYRFGWMVCFGHDRVWNVRRQSVGSTIHKNTLGRTSKTRFWVELLEIY